VIKRGLFDVQTYKINSGCRENKMERFMKGTFKNFKKRRWGDI
jgi:hypothetical protein